MMFESTLTDFTMVNKNSRYEFANDFEVPALFFILSCISCEKFSNLKKQMFDKNPF